MKWHWLAAVLVLAAGCTIPREAPVTDPTRTTGSGAGADSVPLRRLDEAAAFRYNAGLDQPAREVVRDAAAWSALWPRIAGPAGPPHAAPAVDFGREMVLVAAMGQRPTGGYSIEIASVTAAGGELVANVVEQRPGPRCGTTQALTAPVDVVAIPRSTRSVRWEVRQVASDC